MSKEKRLGRGLEALLGKLDSGLETRDGLGDIDALAASPQFADSAGIGSPDATQDNASAERLAVVSVPLDEIEANPFQPRKEIDPQEIAQLAESLANHGLLQPIVVRRHNGRYQLIAGERRLRAAKLAGWQSVPARVVNADDRQLAELAIVENLQRKDLNALEKAECFHRYLEEYGVTQEELASRLSLDRSTVANFIRLLDLPQAVQQALRENRITQGHARALLSLESEEDQIALCEQIQQEGLSVRRVEQIVQERRQRGDWGVIRPENPPQRSDSSEHLAALEQEFRAALGLRVSLTHNGRGRGKLVIQFRSHEEFEHLYEQICGPQRDRAAG